ncbi:hypothetical protein Bca101_051194 [Brassica carinata]
MRHKPCICFCIKEIKEALRRKKIQTLKCKTKLEDGEKCEQSQLTRDLEQDLT